jgi:hypothetical protein
MKYMGSCPETFLAKHPFSSVPTASCLPWAAEGAHIHKHQDTPANINDILIIA